MTNKREQDKTRPTVRKRQSGDRREQSSERRPNRSRDTQSSDRREQSSERSPNRSRDTQSSDRRGQSSERRPNRSRDTQSAKGRLGEKTWRVSKPKPRKESQTQELIALATARIGPGGYKQYSDIPAHKLGRVLRSKLYHLCKELPEDEADNLVIRMKKAATTVTAALVTGFGEGTHQACIQGSLQSRGALYALQDHLDQLLDLELLDAGLQNAVARGDRSGD